MGIFPLIALSLVTAAVSFPTGYSLMKMSMNNNQAHATTEGNTTQQSNPEDKGNQPRAGRMLAELESLQDKQKTFIEESLPQRIQKYQKSKNLSNTSGQADLETLQAIRKDINKLSDSNELAKKQTSFSEDQYLSLGSSGEEVRKLQTELQKRGYYKGKIDGDFGPLTEQAVIAFQKGQNPPLQADGIVGQQTNNRLIAKA